MTAATLVLGLVIQTAMAAEATAFAVVGWTLVATLLALAILEHWFLVLPLPDAALWNWAVRAAERRTRSTGGPSHHFTRAPSLIPATPTQRRQ